SFMRQPSSSRELIRAYCKFLLSKWSTATRRIGLAESVHCWESASMRSDGSGEQWYWGTYITPGFRKIGFMTTCVRIVGIRVSRLMIRRSGKHIEMNTIQGIDLALPWTNARFLPKLNRH